MHTKQPPQPVPRAASWQKLFLAAVVVGGAVWLGWRAYFDLRAKAQPAANATATPIPFDGQRAYDYLKSLCALGRRPSGSPGMAAQQQLLADHFRNLGAEVELQRFEFPDPRDAKTKVPGVNLIVHWHPQRSQRILLCTHYDTLPFPVRDAHNPQGTFLGANDGTSGTALLMALGREIPGLQLSYGVDFAFFDAEEFNFVKAPPDDQFFLGAKFFAQQYVKNQPACHYRWGVLLDMIGKTGLELYFERHSIEWNDTRPLVEEIWATADRLGVRAFVPRLRDDVNDDHVPLHDLGKIPTCDLIDFDYPAWHTEGDLPEQCSADSLAKVGWVLREWLKTEDRR
jgi:hypothetical protein